MKETTTFPSSKQFTKEVNINLLTPKRENKTIIPYNSNKNIQFDLNVRFLF